MTEIDKMSYNGYHGFFNLSKTCRACLSAQDQMQSVPDDVYSYCTSVNISDGFPKVLCQLCFELLNRLYYFKQQCIRSDALLKQHLKPPLLQPQITSSTQLVDSTTCSGVTHTLPTIKFLKEEEEKISDAKSEDCVETRRIINVDGNAPEIIDQTHIYSKGSSSPVPSNDVTFKRKEDDEGFKNIDIPKKKYKKNNKRTTSGSMLYCQKCDKSFYKYVKLEAHMRKHFGMKPDSTISCSQCDKKFTTEKNLKSHLRVHTGERKYKCTTCGKAFAYLNVLKNHERAHAGIKKYVCHQCGKKFVQLTNLNSHLIQHSGEKPYCCEACGRRFGQPSEYKLHLLRHSGVKNFPCSLCPLRFYTNANLQKHMGAHSDIRPYGCKVCDKRFKTRSYLAVHNRSHTGERPFPCQLCPLKFMSGKDRRSHLRSHGPPVPEPPPAKEHCSYITQMY